MFVVGLIIHYLLQLYVVLFFVRMLFGWAPVLVPQFQPRGFLLVAFETVFTITDPLIKFFRRFIPPLRVGAVALDLGFLAAFVTLLAATQLNRAILLS